MNETGKTGIDSRQYVYVFSVELPMLFSSIFNDDFLLSPIGHQNQIDYTQKTVLLI